MSHFLELHSFLALIFYIYIVYKVEQMGPKIKAKTPKHKAKPRKTKTRKTKTRSPLMLSPPGPPPMSPLGPPPMSPLGPPPMSPLGPPPMSPLGPPPPVQIIQDNTTTQKCISDCKKNETPTHECIQEGNKLICTKIPMSLRTKFMKNTLKKRISGENLQVGQYYYIIIPIENYKTLDKPSENSPKKPYIMYATGKCVNVNINPMFNPNNVVYAEFQHFKVLKSRTGLYSLTIQLPDANSENTIMQLSDDKYVKNLYPNGSFYFPQNKPNNVIFVKMTEAKQREETKDANMVNNKEELFMYYGLKDKNLETAISLADIGTGKKPLALNERKNQLLTLMKKNHYGGAHKKTKRTKQNKTKHK